ncbi:hypothetical protein [Novosphingobium sp. Gsoil 351]|uniref:hypothetical protein n=1 Tax=Novosphingobium sp. Gsoil 351 TaxID=2675225 RepID=UPI001E2FE28F|nr:hypothetical protein [Novosphingobium sp. Gsoil 351]
MTVAPDQDNLFEITAVSGDSNLSDLQNSWLAQDIVQKMIDTSARKTSGGRGEMKGNAGLMDQRKSKIVSAEFRSS